MRTALASLLLAASSITSMLILIPSVITQSQPLVLFGIFLLTLSLVVPIFFADKLSRSLLVFIIVLSSLTISLSYETLSSYLLGEDVHAEYYVIERTLHEGHLNIPTYVEDLVQISTYYYEIFSFIMSSAIISHITGLSSLMVIKFIWNSLVVGLIPFMIFLYALYLTGRKPSALVASILILVQSTYIVTLHSTAKQTSSTFMLTVVLLFLAKYIKENPTRFAGLVVTLTVLATIGYHYFTSGVFIVTMFLALILFALVFKLNRFLSMSSSSNSSFSKIFPIVVISTMSWLLWYAILQGSIIRPIVDVVKRLFYLQSLGYSYEYVFIPLPAYLNYARLMLNGVVILTFIVAGLRTIVRLLKKKGDFLDSMVAISVLLLSIALFTELSGISTYGVGRFSILFMLIASAYFYDSFFTIFSKILFNKVTVISLAISLILGARLLFSSGALPYIAGNVENGILLDPTYKFKASMTYADFKAVEFANTLSLSRDIGTDLKSRNRFLYINDLKVKVDEYYFNRLAKMGLNQTESIVYLSSYNIIKDVIQIDLKRFVYLDDYLAYSIVSRSLIYSNGFSAVFQ